MRRIALLACAALPACHLLIPHRASDDTPPADREMAGDPRPARDAPRLGPGAEASALPADLGGPVDWPRDVTVIPPPDLPQPPDLPKPKPDTRPVYIDETFTSGLGVLKSQLGTWTVAGGSVRQPATDYNGYYATAPVPVADYIAEAEITVSSVKGVPSWAEGAGIGVRVQPGAIPPYPPGQYVCGISPDEGLLMVAKCPGGMSNNCVRQKEISAAIPYMTPILVRATIIGSTFTCALPSKGASLTYVNTSYTSGGVSLITFYADASFSYLKVYAP